MIPLGRDRKFSSEYVHYISTSNQTDFDRWNKRLKRYEILLLRKGFITNRKKWSESISSVLSKELRLKQFDP